MKETLFFKLLIILLISIFSSEGQTCPCSNVNNILQCQVTNTSATVDTGRCNSYSSINIIYSGYVVLNLVSSSAKSIVIMPTDGTAGNTLQISTINSNANRITIQIYLSLNQVLLPLFKPSSSIIAPNSIISINVIQNITDANNFQVFPYPSSTTMNFANYEIIFDTTNANSGTLYLPTLIFGLKNLTSIMISGNNHSLAVNKTQMPSSINVTQLSLKNLILYDQILYNFMNLQQYSIEECDYNQTAQFLYSNQMYSSISLSMINNNPINLILPNNSYAFKGLGTLNTLTIIEPALNSTCIRGIAVSTPVTLILEVGSYQEADFDFWVTYRPLVRYVTINNIKDLHIFESKYFNGFDAIETLILQGSFELDEDDLCIFTGITLQPGPNPTKVILNSSKISTDEWNQCANTYVIAIDQDSTNDIVCPPANTFDDCLRWANATYQCDLVTQENKCPGALVNFNKPFTFNNSYLYQYFQRILCLNGTTYPTASTTIEGSINIGAIVGAVCALIVAIIILGLTVFCFNRYRQKNANKNIYLSPAEKYKSASDDSTHLSIATSKTSQSSRYAIQKSFFPPLQPNDEIAPPLYTAPSEAVASLSPYNLPSAPPAPRDSVSTHATHIYETLDS